MDKYNQELINIGKKQGFESGQKQGFESGQKQGFESGQRLIARNLIHDFGGSIEMVAKATGLPIGEVEAIGRQATQQQK